jgi:DNA-binding beta-propeller fold protein YncE
MRTPQLSALVFAVLTFNAVAAEPQKLWEASGFKQPESVVFDRAAGAIYVSNVNGDPMQKDGNGFISKLGPDGKVVTIEWVKGLDSPTGSRANGKHTPQTWIDSETTSPRAKSSTDTRHPDPF